MKNYLQNVNLEHNTLVSLENVGSSETLRKTPLDFHDKREISENSERITKKIHSIFTYPFDWKSVKPFIPQHIKTYSPHFLAWFVGFSEGDGSFIIDSKNKRLFFTITQKESACLHRLRTELGFGLICNDTKNPEMKRFTVTHRDQIKILIHIFNGNLLLKKTNHRFALWVNHYNKLTGDSIKVISRWENVDSLDSPDFTRSRIRMTPETSKCLRNESLLWKTSWLAGFLEAEGCFSAIRKKTSIYFRFILDQTNELEILLAIRFLFLDQGSVWIRKHTPGKIQYRLEISNFECLQDVLNYVKAHPLRTKKNIVFVRWKKLFGLVLKIREEKINGTYVWSEKREKRMNRLLEEIEKASKTQLNEK